MKTKILISLPVLLFIILVLSLFSNNEKEEHHFDDPAHVVESETGSIPSVVLTQRAKERLNIKTITTSKNQLTIPYSTVRYDKYGDTWVYTNPESLVYIRKEVYINSVDDNQVLLLEPLPENTMIVTVGVPELSGVEHGIGQGGGGY